MATFSRDSQVDLLPRIRCKCGKVIAQYHESYSEHIKAGGEPSVFFNNNRITRLCCISAIGSPIVIQSNRYYNTELIQGRVSRDSAITSSIAHDIPGLISGNRTGVYPRPFHQEIGPEQHLIGKRIDVGPSLVGSTPSEAAEKERYKVITGMYGDPVVHTGKFRVVPGVGGVSYKVPIVKPTLLTSPVSSTYGSIPRSLVRTTKN